MPPAARKPSPTPKPVAQAASDVDPNLVTPTQKVEEGTPIHDQIKADLANADPADVTLFEEDDDPTANAGDFVDDEDDTEEKN